MRWKLLALLLTGLLPVSGVALLLNRIGALGGHPRPDTLILQVQRLKQLVTVRVSLQRIVSMTENKVPLGSESILLMVQSEALAGVDFGRISPRDVSITAEGAAQIDLSRAQLLHVCLDENKIRVWDRHATWWTPWVPFNPDLEHCARLRPIDYIGAAALEMRVLPQLQSNAEIAIRDLFSAFNMPFEFISKACRGRGRAWRAG